jgi:hypothetical protein
MQQLLEEALSLWRDCPSDLPAMHPGFTFTEQTAREAQLDAFLAAIQREVDRPPRTRSARHATHARISDAFTAFGKTALGLEDTHLELLLEGGFSAIGTRLARQARAFDPRVSVADILQATRNAWTACGLQMLFGQSMRLTPSIFAYSMLYPYTDNYLDDPRISGETKRGFSGRFGERLACEPVAPANAHEIIIWRLVELIESQYARPQHPNIFESLQMIHHAQTESIRLLRGRRAAGGIDVLRLIFQKGGASVLADGYLAAVCLTPEQARFAFEWGVFLQLADDLQDVVEDRRGGVRTLFSQSGDPLDALTSRTIHFGQRVMLRMRHVADDSSRPLQQMIERSCLSLMVRSAGEAGELYTSAYLATLEKQSPFRFAFLNERRKQFAKRSGALGKLFEAFLAGDHDEPAFPLLPSSLMPRTY